MTERLIVEIVADLRGMAIETQSVTYGRTLDEAADRLEELAEALDRAQLSDIEARNPGINMDEVREFRRTGVMPTKGEGNLCRGFGG